MKTQLKEITIEMGNKELVDTLNENFKALDITIQTMGTQILSKFDNVQKEIKGLKKDISSISIGMDALLKQNNINPKKLLIDSKKK